MKRDVSAKAQEIWASEKEEEGGKVGIRARSEAEECGEAFWGR